MNQTLKNGKNLETETGRMFTIKKLIGSGGQGEVYEIDMEGRPFALKWYFIDKGTEEQRGIIERLIKEGSPNERFLWPLCMVDSPDLETFGYIMPLRERNFAGIIDMMTGKASPSFRTLCSAAYELVDSYQKLHSLGRCYRDISFGNVFFDPKTGKVRICDNDNVTIDGAALCGVGGTQRFMAPEIVRGVASPSIDTDRFSLAVLLFYMLMMHHPLEGKKELDIHCLDGHTMKKLYGVEPIFIWNPKNTSNTPDPVEQRTPIIYWSIYPKFIKALFIKTFTIGIKKPKERVVETEWRRAFIQLRDSITYCGKCGAENFYDADKLQNNEPHICWKCGNMVKLPPRIKVGKSEIILNFDTKLYAHHLVKMADFDFKAPMAELSTHPQNPNIWGLKNLSRETWVMTTPEGLVSKIPPGKNVLIALGIVINFGSTEGEIRF
ncbi:MAG: serine/threonine protein kinase [Clostridiaceae bacterium]|nr:serine/threonine protein kinase [Clostridiaceae bacterium]